MEKNTKKPQVSETSENPGSLSFHCEDNECYYHFYIEGIKVLVFKGSLENAITQVRSSYPNAKLIIRKTNLFSLNQSNLKRIKCKTI